MGVFKSDYLIFILILSTSFLLGLNSNLYVMGGQDQGTYLNMSALFQRQGKLLVRNTFRDTLTKEEQNLFDLHGKYVLPGFQQQGPDESVYLMKFYPLFPASVALFSLVFGADMGFYALTVFSLFSILGFYLLTLEITKDRQMANLVALLIAIQPTHVFFSKFPLTEMATLAFTSFGFYFLIKSFSQIDNSEKGSGKPKPQLILNLALSLLMFNAFFYTRMSSFIYIPFFLIILILIILNDRKNFWAYSIYTSGWILLFLTSFAFYYKKQYALYDTIIGNYVKRVLGPDVLPVLITLSIAYASILLAVYLVGKNKILDKVKNLSFSLSTFAYLLAATFVLFDISDQISKLLTFTENSNRWYFVSGFLSSLKHLTFYQTIIHIGPFLFLLVLVSSIFIYKNREKFSSDQKPTLQIVTIFPAYFLLVTSLFASIFDYNYYRSRYLISEVIPYTILLAVVIYHYTRENRTLNKIFKVLIGCTIIYYAFFSFIQMGTSEGPDVSFYNNLIKTVGKDSLLLVDKSYRSGSAVTAPLVWYYNLSAFIVDEEILKSPILANLIDKNEKVYLLAPYPTSTLTPNQSEKMRLRYNYFSSNPDCSEHSYSYLPIESQTYYLPKNKLSCFLLPSAYFTAYIDLYLFKIK